MAVLSLRRHGALAVEGGRQSPGGSIMPSPWPNHRGASGAEKALHMKGHYHWLIGEIPDRHTAKYWCRGSIVDVHVPRAVPEVLDDRWSMAL